MAISWTEEAAIAWSEVTVMGNVHYCFFDGFDIFLFIACKYGTHQNISVNKTETGKKKTGGMDQVL